MNSNKKCYDPIASTLVYNLRYNEGVVLLKDLGLWANGSRVRMIVSSQSFQTLVKSALTLRQLCKYFR